MNGTNLRPILRTAQALASIFANHDWRWGQRDGKTVPLYVPDAVDLALAIAMLLDTCPPGGEVRNGRLMVRAAHTDEDGYPHDTEVYVQIPWGDDDE